MTTPRPEPELDVSTLISMMRDPSIQVERRVILAKEQIFSRQKTIEILELLLDRLQEEKG